jgi:hypothetical protein
MSDQTDWTGGGTDTATADPGDSSDSSSNDPSSGDNSANGSSSDTSSSSTDNSSSDGSNDDGGSDDGGSDSTEDTGGSSDTTGTGSSGSADNGVSDITGGTGEPGGTTDTGGSSNSAGTAGTGTSQTASPTTGSIGNFDDSLDLTDLRAQDSVQLSSVSDAIAIVETFRSSTATSPWTSLDRSQVADRLETILKDPRQINQGSLNLCGPAAFFNIVTGRHPVAVARCATSLFDTGVGDLGGLHFAPNSALVTTNYADMLSRMQTAGSVAAQADWMLLGSLRNTTSVFWQPSFRGDPAQELAGMTRPEELASWLKSTGIFVSVVDGGKWATNPGIPNASSLPTSQGTDNALLINTNLLAAAKVATSTTASAGQAPQLTPANLDSQNNSFILSMFPNHWVTLLSEVVSTPYTDPNGGTYVTLSVWTWGQAHLSLWIAQSDFLNNYYGAVTTKVSTS